MQSIRRSLSFAGLSLMAMALTFAACTDDGRSPLVPEPPVIAPPASGGPREGVAVQCRATMATREVVCGIPQPSAGGAQLDAVIIGGQHQYVELISSNIVLTDNPATAEADSIFGFDVRIQNILRQPVDGRRQKMGTSDPVAYALDPQGIRIFFMSLTGQGANASLFNADDVGTFTTGNQEYFQYDAVLDSGDVSPPKQWQILLSPGATSFNFTVLVETPVPFREGWIDLTPNVVGLAPTETQSLTSSIRSFVGNVEPGKSIATWNSSNEAVATVDATTGTVTAVGVGTTTITASTASGRQTGTATITVSNAPAVADTTIDAISNVTIPATGLQDRITDQDGGAHVVADTLATAKGGIARLQADGSFDYLSRSGFVGQDTINYQVTDDVTRRPGRVIVNVTGAKYWYVQAGATGDGRDRSPFGSFASAKDSAGTGDVILVLGTAMEGPVTLESGQSLIGQGITTPVTESVNGASVTVLATGSMPTITRTGAGATVALADSNTVRGLRINAPSGAAISGSGFGLLTASELRVAANGPALHLTNGSINAVLDSLSSTGSAAEGLFLSNVGGTLVAGGGSIASAGTVGVSITGGVLSVTYPGSIGSNGQGALISGHAGGALSFAGNVTAPDGVAVSGTAAGSVTFGGTITTAGGIAVSGTGGAAVVTFQRKVTESGQGISITGNTGGMVAFADSLTLSGKGISIGPNAGGTIEFTGAHKSLATGANVAVSIVGDASGVHFGGGGLAITTSGARGFYVQGGGTVQVQGANNTISTTGAEAVFIANASSGVSGITFRNIMATGAANAISLNTLAGTGFQVTGDGSAGSGGTLSATGTAVVVSTADSVRLSSVAVTAPNGVTGSSFGGLGLQSASITATAGAALTLTTGRLHVSDVTVSATNGAALSTNGVALDGALTSLTATTNTGGAVSLVNSTGSLTVPTGTIAVSGAGGGTAVSVSGNTGVSFAFGGSVTQDANAALLSVAGGHTGTLTFNNGTLTANNGSGLQITDGDGLYNINGTLDLSGGDAGIDLGSLSTGAVNVAPAGGHTASIVSPTGAAIAIAGGSADLTFNGTVTQATAAQPLLSVAGAHSGDVSFPTGTLTATNGTGLQFNDADGTYAFGGTVNLSNAVGGADAGIDVLNNSGGTFTFNENATVTNPANQAINIQNGAGTLAFTYSGSFTKNNNAVTGILVQNNAGGSIAFNGDRTTETKLLSTGTAAAVSLVNNGSASIVFGGGGLNITTTSGAGFSATGSGTVQVTGAENTISSTGGGRGVNVQNVSIGASGLTFKSINTNGGSGIVLENTGTTNGIQVTGDGSTANSGGTLALVAGAADSAAVTAREASSVQLRFVRMSLGGSGNGAYVDGFVGENLRGTSELRNSVIDYNNMTLAGVPTRSAFAYRVVNNSANGTLTLDGTTVQNKTDGAAAVNISTLGSSVVSFNVIDSNTGDAFENKFTNLFGSAIVAGAGDDAGSTAVLTATVSNGKFLNAPSNGLNNLELGANQNGTLVPIITNNQFDKVALPLATVGVININLSSVGSGAGRIGSNAQSGLISGNSITNIRSGAGPTFAYDPAGVNGYLGIRVAIDNAVGGVNHKLQILNNTITGLARQGILVSARGSANNVNVRIQGNTVGTLAAPVGASNRRGIEIETQADAVMKVEVLNNPSIVSAGSSGTNASLAIRSGVTTGANGALHATVVGNTISGSNAAATARFRAETGSIATNPTMCLDLRNNVLDAGKNYELMRNVGTFNRNTSGNTGTIVETGAFGSVASCTTPVF